MKNVQNVKNIKNISKFNFKSMDEKLIFKTSYTVNIMYACVIYTKEKVGYKNNIVMKTKN